MLEVIKQNINGWCEQNSCSQKFVDNTQQCFAFTPQKTFTPRFEFSLKVRRMRSNLSYLLKSFLLYILREWILLNGVDKKCLNIHEGEMWLHIYFDSNPKNVIVYIRPSISLSIILLQRKRIWGLPPGQPTRDQQRSTWCIEKALCSNLQKNVLKILVMVVVFCKI